MNHSSKSSTPAEPLGDRLLAALAAMTTELHGLRQDLHLTRSTLLMLFPQQPRSSASPYLGAPNHLGASNHHAASKAQTERFPQVPKRPSQSGTSGGGAEIRG